jgi:membrane protease YdiL (CAAX protease family)
VSSTPGAVDERHSLLRRQLILFFVLAYAIAWVFYGSLALSRAGLGWLPLNLSVPVMTVLGSFAPSLAALLTLRVTGRSWPAPAPLGIRPVWVGFVIAPILIAGTFAAIPAAILTTGPLSSLHWSALLSGSVYTISTLIGGPLGEEPGWRGFALPRLQQLFGPWKASLLLGSLWAAWHLPLFLCQAWSSTSFPTYLLIVTGLSFSMTFLFNLSGASVVTAVAAHAFFNTASRWLGGLLADATLRESPAPELLLGLSGWAIACFLLTVTGGRLAARKSTPENSRTAADRML